MRKASAAVGAALAFATAGAIGVLAAATPAAAATCSHGVGGSHAHWDARRNISWPQDWICGNRANAKVYANPYYSTDVAGLMKSTTSWFVCWQYGQKHSGGNTVWYYTQGDVSYISGLHAWGWIPAVDVWTPQDPLSGMTRCSFSIDDGD